MSSLEVDKGPMFSNKTTKLVEKYHADTRKKVAIKPKLDTRHQDPFIHSRNKTSCPALVIEKLAHFEVKDGLQVVYIDEFQFFDPEDLIAFIQRMKDHHVHIVCAGLDEYSSRELWPAYKALIDLPPNPQHIFIQHEAVCYRCKGPALHTMRMIHNDAPILVGDSEAYQPACSDCHVVHV